MQKAKCMLLYPSIGKFLETRHRRYVSDYQGLEGLESDSLEHEVSFGLREL